jgi:hypothetical protein
LKVAGSRQKDEGYKSLIIRPLNRMAP